MPVTVAAPAAGSAAQGAERRVGAGEACLDCRRLGLRERARGELRGREL